MLRAKKQPTLRVFIKQDIRDEIRTITPRYTSDGRILLIMEPTTEKKAGWTIDATGYIRNDQFGPYIAVYRGSPIPIDYNVPERKTEKPIFTKDDFHQFTKLDAFRAVYGKMVEAMNALKPFLWVAIIIGIAALAIGIYNAWTVSHLPTSFPTTTNPPTQVIP